MTGFILETTPDEKSCFILFNAVDELCTLPNYSFKGSYNVVAARVMGLSYPQWLLYCKDNGATIAGKTGYAGARWAIKDKAKVQAIIRELNKLWNEFMKGINLKGEVV